MESKIKVTLVSYTQNSEKVVAAAAKCVTVTIQTPKIY